MKARLPRFLHSLGHRGVFSEGILGVPAGLLMADWGVQSRRNRLRAWGPLGKSWGLHTACLPASEGWGGGACLDVLRASGDGPPTRSRTITLAI